MCTSIRIRAQAPDFGTEALDVLVGYLDKIQIMAPITSAEGYSPLLTCMNSSLNGTYVCNTLVL